MNSEELKLAVDFYFNLRKKLLDKNKIKKDKYRLRKAVKKSQLQNRMKELYEEERITQLDRNSATDELFKVINWMTREIYYDLGFDFYDYEYCNCGCF
jgi:hypothetical protein